MRVQVCGLVAVERDGIRYEDQLPGRQGRLLVVYLVTRRDRVCTRDELAAAVWGDDLPAAWPSALSALLSKLRRVLGDGTVSAGGDVRLVLPPDVWIDLEAAADAAHRAESAAATGDVGRAWGAAQTALFATRRTVLPGEDHPWVHGVRRYADEIHVRALEAYAEAALGLGGTELSTAERAARELTGLAPYRESAARMLMRAHAAQGNVAQALVAFEDLRGRLRDDLGTEPCAATRALHTELLRGAV